MALWKRGLAAPRVRGVVDSYSTNPTGADILRPSSMLKMIHRLSLISTFRGMGLGQFVKRPLYAQRKRVISWLISVIVNARSQLEYARRDKLEGNDNNVLQYSKGSNFL